MNILIVDMIEGFARIGPLASPRVEALIKPQCKFLDELSGSKKCVVFACDAHSPNNAEFRRMPTHCLKDTPQSEICKEIVTACDKMIAAYRNSVHNMPSSSHVVQKTTHSAFFQTDLDAIIDEHEIPDAEWVLFGCVTDICILANLMELDYRGKSVVLLSDLMDTYDVSGHNADEFNAFFLEKYIPAVWKPRILTSEEFLKEQKIGRKV